MLETNTLLAVTETSNGTHAFLSFTSLFDPYELKIIGTTVIPEFPTMLLSWMFLFLLALVFLLTYRPCTITG
ncbi:hypothetical protein MUP77_15390 [Candidatus Bathyarchaeota archaeon]|nr:hypothetical protein [Candidatus Bathyarchaeota archaeon]